MVQLTKLENKTDLFESIPDLVIFLHFVAIILCHSIELLLRQLLSVAFVMPASDSIDPIGHFLIVTDLEVLPFAIVDVCKDSPLGPPDVPPNISASPHRCLHLSSP